MLATWLLFEKKWPSENDRRNGVSSFFGGMAFLNLLRLVALWVASALATAANARGGAVAEVAGPGRRLEWYVKI